MTFAAAVAESTICCTSSGPRPSCLFNWSAFSTASAQSLKTLFPTELRSRVWRERALRLAYVLDCASSAFSGLSQLCCRVPSLFHQLKRTDRGSQGGNSPPDRPACTRAIYLSEQRNRVVRLLQFIGHLLLPLSATFHWWSKSISPSSGPEGILLRCSRSSS